MSNEDLKGAVVTSGGSVPAAESALDHQAAAVDEGPSLPDDAPPVEEKKSAEEQSTEPSPEVEPPSQAAPKSEDRPSTDTPKMEPSNHETGSEAPASPNSQVDSPSASQPPAAPVRDTASPPLQEPVHPAHPTSEEVAARNAEEEILHKRIEQLEAALRAAQVDAEQSRQLPQTDEPRTALVMSPFSEVGVRSTLAVDHHPSAASIKGYSPSRPSSTLHGGAEAPALPALQGARISNPIERILSPPPRRTVGDASPSVHPGPPAELKPKPLPLSKLDELGRCIRGAPVAAEEGEASPPPRKHSRHRHRAARNEDADELEMENIDLPNNNVGAEGNVNEGSLDASNDDKTADEPPRKAKDARSTFALLRVLFAMYASELRAGSKLTVVMQFLLPLLFLLGALISFFILGNVLVPTMHYLPFGDVQSQNSAETLIADAATIASLQQPIDLDAQLLSVLCEYSFLQRAIDGVLPSHFHIEGLNLNAPVAEFNVTPFQPCPRGDASWTPAERIAEWGRRQMACFGDDARGVNGSPGVFLSDSEVLQRTLTENTSSPVLDFLCFSVPEALNLVHTTLLA